MVRSWFLFITKTFTAERDFFYFFFTCLTPQSFDPRMQIFPNILSFCAMKRFLHVGIKIGSLFQITFLYLNFYEGKKKYVYFVCRLDLFLPVLDGQLEIKIQSLQFQLCSYTITSTFNYENYQEFWSLKTLGQDAKTLRLTHVSVYFLMNMNRLNVPVETMKLMNKFLLFTRQNIIIWSNKNK